MQKVNFLIKKWLTIVSILLSLSLPSIARAKWHVETVDSNVYETPSLALQGDTTPCIAYGYSADLYYTEKKQGTWATEYVEGTGNVQGVTYPSLVLDFHGIPHISYQYEESEKNFHTMKYAKKNSPNWDIEIVEDQQYSGRGSSIAMMDDSTPCIAYFNGGGSVLMYAKWTPSGWQKNIVDVDSGHLLKDYVSLAIDKNNIPHVTCARDSIGTNYQIKYAKWNGTLWETTVIDSGGNLHDPKLVVDSSLYVHLIYSCWPPSGSDQLKYARWNGVQWEIQVVDTGGISSRQYGITIDKNQTPIVVYTQWEGPIICAKYNAGEFIRDTLVSSEPLQVKRRNLSVKVDKANFPHIAYRLESTKLLKYAYFTNMPPLSFPLISPAQTETTTTLPMFYWHKSIDPDTENTNYIFYITTDSLYSTYDSSIISSDTVCSLPDSLINFTKYFWKVKAIDPYGAFTWCQQQGWWFYTKVEIGIEDKEIPDRFVLFLSNPNPSTGNIIIKYGLPEKNTVKLNLFDISGRLVKTIYSGIQDKGYYIANIKDNELTKGVYFIRFKAGDYKNTKKLILL